jgi:hypothetical protein
MNLFELIGHIVTIAAKHIVYMLMALPLVLSDLIGLTADYFAGVRDISHGHSLWQMAAHDAPPFGFDEYICFDFDVMFPDEPNKFRYTYTVHFDPQNYDAGEPSQPFFNITLQDRGMIWALWNQIPAGFRTSGYHGRRMNHDFVFDYARFLYRNSVILNFDGTFTQPATHQFDGTTYWYVPGEGEEESKQGLFETQIEAAMDYTRRNFFFMGRYVRTLPQQNFIDPDGAAEFETGSFEHHHPDSLEFENDPANPDFINPRMHPDFMEDLGPPISILTREQVQDREMVRYWGANEFHRTEGSAPGLWLWEEINLVNLDMLQSGFTGFAYPEYSFHGINNWANVKYSVQYVPPHFNHVFSIQLYYSTTPFWREYIDHMPLYVADISKWRSDWERYTSAAIEWMTLNNITPGTEEMYREIANNIIEGQRINESLRAAGGTNGGTTLASFIWGHPVTGRIFWGITLISFVLCVAFSIAAVLQSMSDLEEKRPVGKVAGSIGKAMLMFLIVPVFMIITINVAGIGIRQVSYLIDQAAGVQDNSHSLLSAIIMSTAITEDSILRPQSNVMAQEVDRHRQMLMTGEIPIDVFGQTFMEYFDPLKMNIIPTIITGCFCVVIMTMILLMFVRRIFEVMMLYIVAPIFVATIPLDEGAKFKLWREAFISRTLMGFSALFTLKIILLLLPVFWLSGIQLLPSAGHDAILKLLITIGGMATAYKSQTLISNIIDINMAAAEKETSSTITQYAFSSVINKVHPMNIRNKLSQLRQEGKAWKTAFKNASPERAVKPDKKREDKINNAVNQHKENFDGMKPGLKELKNELEDETNYKIETLDDFLKREPQKNSETNSEVNPHA